MKKAALFLTIIPLLCATLSYGEEAAPVELKGIEVGMKKKRLVENWGFPIKRETRRTSDTWFYTNDNTPHPTDGIVVFFRRGRVREWKVVENIYTEMKIWGKSAGSL
jgi:hypothetical protein